MYKAGRSHYVFLNTWLQFLQLDGSALYYVINLVIRHFSTWIHSSILAWRLTAIVSLRLKKTINYIKKIQTEIKKKTQLSNLALLKKNLFIKMEKSLILC